MFSFRNNKANVEIQNLLRRITDLSTPNASTSDDNHRLQDRSNRTLPVLLAPWEDDQAVISEAASAVTKDIGDRGIALVLRAPFHGDQVVLGFWLANDPRSSDRTCPYFLIGRVRQNVEIGGGFWQLGIEVIERLNTVKFEEQVERLMPVAAKLVPRKEPERVASLAK